MLNFTSAAQKTVVIIISSCFFYGLSIGMDFVLIPLMFKNAGLSKSTIGLLMGIEIAAAFFMAPLLPHLVRRWGMGWVLFIAGAVRNGTLLLLPLCNSTTLWFPAMFLAGSGGFSLYITTQIWLNSLTKDKHRATMLSALTALLSLGIAAGPLLLELTGNAGFFPFFISSILCSLIALPFYLRRATLPERIEERGVHVLAVIRQSPIAVLGGTVSDFIFFSMTSFLVLYGLAHGLSEAQAALLITAMMCGGIIIQVPVGWISDHINRPLMVIICTIIPLICSQILALIIKNPYEPWIVFTFCSGAISGIYSTSLALLSETFRGKDLIAANSAFAMMNSVGGLSGVILSGIAMDLWGPEGLTYSIAFICTLYLLMNSVQYALRLR